MSMFYDPQVVRALTCERIRDARGHCVDGQVFELPHRDSAIASAVRRLFARLSPAPEPETCSGC